MFTFKSAAGCCQLRGRSCCIVCTSIHQCCAPLRYVPPLASAAHSGGRSWRSAMTICLRQVTASLRLRLQEVCGWLLSTEREDLLLACEPFPFLCAMFGPLAEGAALCSVLYAHLNLRTTHLTLACQHLLSFLHTGLCIHSGHEKGFGWKKACLFLCQVFRAERVHVSPG